MIYISGLPVFQDNYIWLIENDLNANIAVVDPGSSKEVIDYCIKHNKLLTDILITHHHHDHIGGIPELANKFSPEIYGPFKENIPCITQRLVENDKIELFGADINIIDTPGHTLGHISYFTSHNNHPYTLFCGDTLFCGGCGRLFEGTVAQMFNSLNKLAALPVSTLIYCAHEYTQSNLQFAYQVEPKNSELTKRIQAVAKSRDNGESTVPSTLEIELKTNPFLRTEQPEIISSAEHHSGTPLKHSEDVFATIRKWKDNY